MDSSQLHARGSRPSYPPRASSRSSTSTVNTRVTSQSANSLTSVSTSPQLSSSHPAHRFLHTPSSKVASSPRPTPRHTPQLSREGSMESTRQTAASAFLQEKLQRERRAEGERMGHVSGLARISTDMSGSLEFGRATLDSPMRLGFSDSPRPRSSAGASAGAEPAKRQGMGLMEMEQVISKLHKQNFDLKLELYHRREKQTMLELQVEALENDKRQMEEINDSLLEELDKRDKAVEEAVAMIVELEAKAEQSISPRNVGQQMNRQGFFYEQDPGIKHDNRIPDICAPETPAGAEDEEGGSRVVNRMPSFLADETDLTKNLRNVYLDVRGSAISLPRLTEGSPELENGPANGLASPTLSVLSESSFLSVYGKKEEAEEEMGYPPAMELPLSLDAADPGRLGALVDEYHGSCRGKLGGLPVRAATANPFTRGGPGHGHQPFERPSTTRVDGRRGPQPPPLQMPPSHMPPMRRLVREETREALKRVMTEAPGGVRLHDQGQDSHQGRNCDSPRTLQTVPERQKGHRQQRSGVSLVERPLPQGAAREVGKGSQRRDKEILDEGGDSDDESDTRSLQSSMDIWMRESTKPARNGGRASPDLFGFPSVSGGGWNPPDTAYMQNLHSLRQALFTANAGPSPPDRRSSLHSTAQTRSGSISESAQATPIPAAAEEQRPRHSRGHSDIVAGSVQQTVAGNGEKKTHHYPPITGQQGGARSGLNRLFRRSIGGGSLASATSESVAAAAAAMGGKGPTLAEAPRITALTEARSWFGRDEDDRSGATPPPIMLNPRQQRRNTAGAEMMPDHLHGKAEGGGESGRQTPTLGKGSTPGTPSGTGMRRKWLPTFSRTSSGRR